jgi:hypothetical protein
MPIRALIVACLIASASDPDRVTGPGHTSKCQHQQGMFRLVGSRPRHQHEPYCRIRRDQELRRRLPLRLRGGPREPGPATGAAFWTASAGSREGVHHAYRTSASSTTAITTDLSWALDWHGLNIRQRGSPTTRRRLAKGHLLLQRLWEQAALLAGSGI